MRKGLLFTTTLGLFGLSIVAQANVFNLGNGFVSLQTVRVGDVGNKADTRYDKPGYGSVGYYYKIGKYEVTAKQYTEFLNAKAKSDPYGLYDTYMDTKYSIYGCNIKRYGVSGSYSYIVPDGWANRPVNCVTFWDACRFTNWLSNGQGDGDTETGAYTLSGYNGNDGRAIQRNANWKWALPTENEWYKAAYYKGGGTNAGYWEYPTKSNSVTTEMANYLDSIGFITDVCSYAYAGPYGTYDQGGNVGEWNEALFHDTNRGIRGGHFSAYSNDFLRAAYRYGYANPNGDTPTLGFRVVQAVPEPSSIIALLGGLVSLVGIRRRKA